MKKIFLFLAITFLFSGFSFYSKAAVTQSLCSNSKFKCVKVAPKQTWASMFPDEKKRFIVQKINRINIGLRPGMTLVVPKKFKKSTLMEASPFSKRGGRKGQKTVEVKLSQLAWGAYDADGKLVNWGPMAGGKGWCPDTGKACRTPTGTYTVFSKRGASCKSGVFPIPTGGAPMPYCMFFNGGYAIHGSTSVPGYHASHGCVRVFNDDAKWLSNEFVDLPNSRRGILGTKVVIRP